MPETRFGIVPVTRFYLPLLLQAFSQSLTYPLVAGVVSHGPMGIDTYTAFNQGMMIMFMIGALGGGLVMTGMIFAKTRFGYLSFCKLNTIMSVALLALMAVLGAPPFDNLIFSHLFALPAELASVAKWTLLLGTIMNAGFFLRNVPMVVLFNNLESGKANNATIARIAMTFLVSVVFQKTGLVGPWWGLFALTLGVWLELGITWLYARPYVMELLKTRVDAPHSVDIFKLTLEQFRFTLPLSLGYFLLALSPLIIATFVARTTDPADMLAVHYVTLGVANPVAYAALRMQAVAIKFMPEFPGDRRLLYYAIAAGAVLGIVPLVFSTDLLGDWYFGVFQNVPQRILNTSKIAIGIYSLISIIHAVRARIEGIAAARKHPNAVMLGQIAYTVSLLLSCMVALWLGWPGWVMALTAIFIAPIGTGLTVYLTLWLSGSGASPRLQMV